MRKLTLNKEILAELSSDELTAVVGGQQTEPSYANPCPTPPTPFSQLRCTFSLSPHFC